MKYLYCAALSLALAIAPHVAAAQMHAPPPMTKAQFQNAPIGSQVEIVVRVVDRQRETVHAQLLAQIDPSHYKATNTQLDLYLTAETPIMMGSNDEVRAGAVLYVYGVVTARNQVDAKRVVVTTRYATVS